MELTQRLAQLARVFIVNWEVRAGPNSHVSGVRSQGPPSPFGSGAKVPTVSLSLERKGNPLGAGKCWTQLRLVLS